MTLLEKIQWNYHYHFNRLRMRLFGRELICDTCGQPIARVILHFRSGVIRLEGLEHGGAYIDFKTQDELRFRHMDQSECRKNSTSSH